MKSLKIWFFICLVFAFISLETLIEEGLEVVYEERNETEPVQYLVCAKLSDLYPNQTQIDLKHLRDDLSDYFNIPFDREMSEYLGQHKAKKLKEFSEFARNRTKSGGYLVLNSKACLIVNESEYASEGCDLFLYYLIIQEIDFVNFAIKKSTFSFVQIQYRSPKVDQLTVLKKGPPYSDCSKSNRRFHCLNECFKRKARLSFYFYDSKETGRIQLNFSDRFIEQRNCFKECKRENCKMTQMISVNSFEGWKTLEAQPKLNAFDYWIQLIGLLAQFAGLSFNEFALVAIEFTRSKMRRRRVRIALFFSKFAVIFLGLASLGYLCALVAFDYQTNNLITKETKHFIQPKTVHLAICVEIDKFVNYDGKMMWEIERATDVALDDALKRGIYLEYQGRSFLMDHHVHPKVWFKYTRRCFSVSIQPTYWAIPSDPKLTIEFKKRVYPQLYPEVYLLSENENLNRDSFMHDNYAFQKRIVKRLKSRGGCIDYKEKYTNCTGRQNCVERCIVKKFMKMYNRIPSFLNPIVDRDWFSAIEWNTTKLMILQYKHFDSFLNMIKQCLQEIPAEEPCLEIKFENKFGKTVKLDKSIGEAEKIDLRFDVVRSVEAILSPYKLALDLGNLQSIFFGFTVFSILQMTGSFVQRVLKVRKNKLVLIIVYLLCSIGANWNTVRIFDVIVNGELVPTEYYELARQAQMPSLVFCFSIDQKLIDADHRLTGNYLEELTRQMTAESQFVNISYLDQSNEWILFDHSRVERFFLLDMKCFRIKVNHVYDRNQFYLKMENQVLKANISKTTPSHRQLNDFYFMTKNEETAEFSKIVKLNGNLNGIRSSINHETSLYRYEDRFSFIRRQVPSSQEESASDLSAIDLHEQLVALEDNEHNLRTLNLPLEEEAFDLEVNEDLFKQLYSVQKQKNQPTNYQQMFVSNHLKDEIKSLSADASDFTFSLVFLQKIVHSTNEETFSKLILNLLNVLCLWFDLGVPDLHMVLVRLHGHVNFPDKIKRFLRFTCKRLKKIKRRLKLKLSRVIN